MTYNGTNCQVYVDGLPLALSGTAGTLAGTIINTGQARIGSLEGNGNPDEFWDGNIDEVRIWNGVRSLSDIQTNKDCRLSGSEPGLIGYWDLEEGTGLTTTNLVTTAACTLLGSATWDTIQPLNCPTGIKNLKNNIGVIKIAPNPFSETTTLFSKVDFNNAEITITNTQGQVVKRIKNINGKSVILDRDYLPDGIFYLQIIEEGKKIFTTTLIVSSGRFN
jgi:hypothetical protein